MVSQQSDPRAAGPLAGVRKRLRTRRHALAARDRPTVTVAIPCFNYGPVAARLVDELKDLQERRPAFDVAFAGPAGSIPEVAVLQRLANRSIARDALRSACHLYDRGKATGEMGTALTGVAREVAPVEAVRRDWRRQLRPFAWWTGFRRARASTASRLDPSRRRGHGRT